MLYKFPSPKQNQKPSPPYTRDRSFWTLKQQRRHRDRKAKKKDDE